MSFSKFVFVLKFLSKYKKSLKFLNPTYFNSGLESGLSFVSPTFLSHERMEIENKNIIICFIMLC